MDSSTDEYGDWDEAAQALASMPTDGVRHFIATLVTQWEIAGRAPDELVGLLTTEMKNAASTHEPRDS